MDSLDITDRFYEKKYQDMETRLYRLYDCLLYTSFEELGCKAAYNLDGGHCSFMTFLDKVANHPYKPEHEVADGIFITEGL